MVHFSHIALKSSRHIRNFGDKRHVYGLPIALMREEMHKWKLETSATDYYQRRGLCLADMLFPQKRRPTLCSWSPPWLRHVISTDTRYLEAYTSRFKPLGHFMRGGAPFPPKYPAPPLILIKVMFCRFLIRWEKLFMQRWLIHHQLMRGKVLFESLIMGVWNGRIPVSTHNLSKTSNQTVCIGDYWCRRHF